MSNDKLVSIIKELLKELGANLENPNFRETPQRVAKMLKHFFRDDKKKILEEIKQKVFPSENDQMVILKGIECFGMCPHHLVPIVYTVDIGYVPNGKVLGLSKLARLAIALSSFPKLQEDFTREIADVLESSLEPLGVMVVVRGIHSCIRCRGVEKDSIAITSDCRGVLRRKPEARMEFLELIRG
jgi:GTP cyclohydrolase I